MIIGGTVHFLPGETDARLAGANRWSARKRLFNIGGSLVGVNIALSESKRTVLELYSTAV
jgi:ABC-type cobalamin transport system permease subunit